MSWCRLRDNSDAPHRCGCSYGGHGFGKPEVGLEAGESDATRRDGQSRLWRKTADFVECRPQYGSQVGATPSTAVLGWVVTGESPDAVADGFTQRSRDADTAGGAGALRARVGGNDEGW